MNLTSNIIGAGCGAVPARATQWIAPLQTACDKFEINTPLRVAAFLATIGVESARLTAVSENLNYSAAGLLSTFPSYFDEDEAQQYANKPSMIANRVYANGMGMRRAGTVGPIADAAAFSLTPRSASCPNPNLIDQPLAAPCQLKRYPDAKRPLLPCSAISQG